MGLAEPQTRLERRLGRPWGRSDRKDFKTMPRHRCHAAGCEVEILPRLLFCKRHWFMLPQRLRNKVWAVYRPGQEVTKDPTPEYMAVQQEAVACVAAQEEKDAGPPL